MCKEKYVQLIRNSLLFFSSIMLLCMSFTSSLHADWNPPPVNISPIQSDAFQPQVAVDNAGNAVAVWKELIGSRFVIRAALLPSGSTLWVFAGLQNGVLGQTEISLLDRDAFDPQVSVNVLTGDAVVIWNSFDGINNVVQAARYSFIADSWSSPIDLSQPFIGDPNLVKPQVAVDSLGNAVAVWSGNNGINRIIQGSTLAIGNGSWMPTTNLSIPGQDAFNPQVAIDVAGNAVAVWQRMIVTNVLIQSATLPVNTGTWTIPILLSGGGEDSFNPQVGAYGVGQAVAIWKRFNGVHFIVQARQYDFLTQTLGAVTDLSAVGQHADLPQIAVDPTGDAVAVWKRFNGSNFIIQSKAFIAGVWTPALAHNLSALGQDADLPQVAVDALGNAVAVWKRFDGANFIIQSKAFIGDAWTPAVANDLSQGGQNADAPQVAVDPTGGDAVAVWSRFNNSSYSVVQGATLVFNTINWVTTTDLSGREAIAPQVDIDSMGDLTVAVWVEINGVDDSSDSIIKASMLISGSSDWSAPVALSLAGGSANAPQIAVDPLGNAVAVWSRFDGSNLIIQASRLCAGSTEWSSPVDLSLPGQDAFLPRVAIDSTGDAVAVWRRFDGLNFITQAATFASDSKHWSSPVDLSQSGQDTFDQQVGIDSSGNAIAVWRRIISGPNGIIQAARYVIEEKKWIATDDVSPAGQNVNQPQVAVDPNGNAVAVWRRFNGADFVIQGATLAFDSKTWVPTSDLSQPGQDAFTPEVVVDSFGNAVAVWERFDGANSIVQGATLAFGNTIWLPTTDLSASFAITIPGRAQPQIAVNEITGNAIAIWRFNGVNDIGIIQSAKLPFNSTVWVNLPDLTNLTLLTQDVFAPKVAMDLAGHAVAVWREFNGTHNSIQAITGNNFFPDTVNPNPPTNFNGTVSSNHFATQTEFIHTLTWDPSPDPTILSYLIFQGSELLETVSADAPLSVTIRNRCRDKQYLYLLVALSSDGSQTVPVPLELP